MQVPAFPQRWTDADLTQGWLHLPERRILPWRRRIPYAWFCVAAKEAVLVAICPWVQREGWALRQHCEGRTEPSHSKHGQGSAPQSLHLVSCGGQEKRLPVCRNTHPTAAFLPEEESPSYRQRENRCHGRFQSKKGQPVEKAVLCFLCWKTIKNGFPRTYCISFHP